MQRKNGQDAGRAVLVDDGGQSKTPPPTTETKKGPRKKKREDTRKTVTRTRSCLTDVDSDNTAYIHTSPRFQLRTGVRCMR